VKREMRLEGGNEVKGLKRTMDNDARWKTILNANIWGSREDIMHLVEKMQKRGAREAGWPKGYDRGGGD